jgi:hypothetical protein
MLRQPQIINVSNPTGHDRENALQRAAPLRRDIVAPAARLQRLAAILTYPACQAYECLPAQAASGRSKQRNGQRLRVATDGEDTHP